MTKYRRIMALSLLLALFIPVYAAADPASVQSPVGEWLVKDGTAHIRIVPCEKKLWGVISWVNEPDTDKNNPDISKRGQPVLGLPILLAMQPGDSGRWDGRIYNAQNGKIYDGNISLTSPDVLHIQGCVLFGLLCGSEDWTRLKAAAEKETSESICRRVSGG